MQLSSIDLNLLVVLDAILQTGSVKEASREVALSPSATSHALARLRELFDDPLLIRAGRTMVLSTRAEQLKPRVREALDRVQGVFTSGQRVDPATLQREFTVVTTDYGELVVVRGVGRRVANLAPGVDLFCRRRSRGLGPRVRPARARARSRRPG